MTKHNIKKLGGLFKIVDVFLSPLILLSAAWFRLGKFLGLTKLPVTKNILFKIGVFPIVDHYYDPLFNYRYLKSNYSEQRVLEGIDFRENDQVNLLNELNFQNELIELPFNKTEEHKYYLNNGSYSGSDACLLYSLIRRIKPKRIIEVGSGFSTLLLLEAVGKNKTEDNLYDCQIQCVEPYEVPWLNKLQVAVIRQKVEDLEVNFFDSLQDGDILFIDSSHIIRPQGDVLCEILQILPRLNKGVYIHFHDIFTPFNYPISWLKRDFRLWNEQYLLEAFMSFNQNFQMAFTLNFLINRHYDNFVEKFPIITEPIGSACWIKKVK